MKNLKVKHLFYVCSMLALMFVFGCSKKKEAGGASLLYGENSKRWHADKEKDATGDKVKQTDEDESAVMQFFANGNYSMTSNTQNSAGTYTYDQAGRSIILTPSGSPTSMSFEVTKLDENELDLKAPDGSIMELEAD
jgi:hypothetical protein